MVHRTLACGAREPVQFAARGRPCAAALWPRCALCVTLLLCLLQLADVGLAKTSLTMNYLTAVQTMGTFAWWWVLGFLFRCPGAGFIFCERRCCDTARPTTPKCSSMPPAGASAPA